MNQLIGYLVTLRVTIIEFTLQPVTLKIWTDGESSKIFALESLYFLVLRCQGLELETCWLQYHIEFMLPRPNWWREVDNIQQQSLNRRVNSLIGRYFEQRFKGNAEKCHSIGLKLATTAEFQFSSQGSPRVRAYQELVPYIGLAKWIQCGCSPLKGSTW